MWHSLRFRLTTVFVGLAVGPLLLVGAILARQSFAVQQAQALHLQRQVAQRVSVQIEAFIRERESEIHTIGDMWNPTESDHEQQRRLLSGLLFHQEDVYEELTLLDGEGREQFRVSRLGMIAADLREWPVADEFVIPQARGETYYSPVWFDDVTGEPLMTIALPVFDLRTGAVDGVLVADFRFKTVWNLIADEQVSEGESVYVVDDQARVVAHRNPSVVLGATQFDLPDQDGVHIGLSGEDVVMTVARVQLGEQHLSVVAEKATSEAFELALNTVYVTSGVVVLALVIASGLGVLAMRRIVQPVETLASVARSIMAGDLSRQADVTKRDEIGDLAKTFNSMTAQLRQTLEELEQRVVDLKRAEEALQRSEEHFRALIENASDIIMILNADATIRYGSPAVGRLLDYEPEDFIGKRPSEFVHMDDLSMIMEAFSHTLQNPGVALPVEFRLRHKDGSWRMVEAIGNNLLEEPAVNGIVINIRDVTERKQAEGALRESELRYRALFENAPVGFSLTTVDGRILACNDTLLQMTGYSEEEMLRINVIDIYQNPKERAHVLEQLEADGSVRNYETVLRRKDGTSYHASLTIAPLALGDEEGLLAVIEDTTERKRAEEALRKSEELLNNILTASAVGIAHSKNRDIIWANEAMVSLFGFTAEEQYLGKGTNILYPSEEEYRRVGKIIYEQQRTGRIVELDTKFKRQDGSLFDGYLRINALDPLDPIKGVIVSIIDITERKQAEEERSRLLVQIQEQVRRVEQIMDTVPEGVLLLDADGWIVLANPMAEGYLVVLADAKVGDTLTYLGDRPLAELLTPPSKGLWHEVKADGQTFEIVARPMGNGSGPEDWVLVISDVTWEREIQQRVQQQERLAAVGQLAAGIAHDFNNIMASIVLYAQMTARTEGLSTTIQERMETINQQAKHATDLIQQILDFGRRAVLKRRPLDLLPLLKEQVKLLERTLPENIEIELDYGPDEDSALFIVHADPTRMQQIVTNLAVNSRDAMPQGGRLRIELKRIRVEGRKTAPLPEMEAGDWVQVTVSDTGVGIPPNVLPRIYEPFFTTKAPLGSGLGLAQVHGIVAQHEGCIDVETQLGQGTTFTIYLPALQVHQPEELDQETTHLAQGQGQMILVVEDNTVARRALMESLELLNYRVLEASNGQQALEVLERRASEADRDVDQITLVLSDMVMPGMGGVALFHALREKYPQVRLVLLTGHPLVDELKDLSAQGLSGWLLKPPSLEQLAEVIARALIEI